MTLQELLNADVNSIGEWARQGFAWWIDELAALLPSGLRERLSSRPRRIVEPVAPSGWRHWHNGRPLSGVQAAKPLQGGLALVLPPDSALVRRLEYPRLPLSDVRRMISLDLERLSPLAPALIYHDVEVLDREAADGKQIVLLGVIPKARAIQWLSAAHADGLTPTVVGVARASGSPAYQFDFLPALKADAGEPDSQKQLRYWWAAVAALLVLNIAGLVIHDMAEVSKLQQAVNDQNGAVNAASQLRRRVLNEERQRGALLARQAQSDPLRILDSLSRVLPANAWVQRLEWNGQTVRIVGYKTGDIDLLAALRTSPLLANPRLGTPDTAAKPGVAPPFDISADAVRRPR